MHMSITLSKLFATLIYPSGWIFLLTLLGVCLLLIKRSRTGQMALVAALLIYLVGASPIVARQLIKSLEQNYPPLDPANAPYADAIVLLGGGLDIPIPPRKTPQLVSGSDRLWQAAQLYNAGRAPYLVIAGGNVFSLPDFEGEAHYIAEVLIAWGVPRDNILLETDSRTTHQNATNIAPILNALEVRTILLVTSAYHMKRSLGTFRQQLPDNIRIIPASSDVLITNDTGGGTPPLLAYIPQAEAFSRT